MQSADPVMFFVRLMDSRWIFGRMNAPTAFESFDSKDRAIEVAHKVMARHPAAELLIEDGASKRRRESVG